MKKEWLKRAAFLAVAVLFCVSGALMAMADSIITDAGTITTEELSAGVTYTQEMGATSSRGNQNLFTVTYDYTDPSYDLAVGGEIGSRATVSQMAASLGENPNYTVLAGVNGDHFSYGTGVPLGFSMDDGEILESPVSDKDADGYMFYTLGIRRDGTSVAGYNPTLIATHKEAGMSDLDRFSIARINRTRESFATSVLFTPAYGASTKTSGGKELVIEVQSGSVSPQANPLVGTVTAISTEGNSALEEGTVVLSCQDAAVNDLASYEVGDTIEMTFSFVEKEWNDVDFAIGGNYSIVQNGQAMEYDYVDPSHPDSDGSPFISAASRTAIGVTKEGKVVIVATDGRGAGGGVGFTANEMSHYMAEDMQCENAVLMDGGGSTAIGVLKDGSFQIRNTPSDGSERAVGNGVFVVKLGTPRPEQTPPTEPTEPYRPDPFLLLPSTLEGSTQTGLTASLDESGSVVITSTGSGSLSYPVNGDYNIKHLPNMFFSITSDVGVNVKVNYKGLNAGSASIVGDWGPDFGVAAADGYLKEGVYDDRGENGADYTGKVAFTGSVSYNKNIPADNIIHVDSIEISVNGAGTVTVSQLYMSDLAMEDPAEPVTSLTDSSGGSLDAAEPLPEGSASLKIEETEVPPEASALPNVLAVYDISVLDEEGNAVPVEGNQLTVRLPLTEALKGFGYYQVVSLGQTQEILPAEADGEFLVFKTTHLSEYAVQGSNEPFAEEPSEDILDALTLYQYVSGAGTLTEEELAKADINSDGAINMLDAYLLYLMTSGQ